MLDRIDMHAHFLPGFYREALLAAGQDRPDGIRALPAWDEVTALNTMDQLGIRTAMLSISSPGVHFGETGKAVELARQVNEEAARLVAAHPGRFGFFASLPVPDIAEAVTELRYALDVLGADGIVLATHQHGVYLGNRRLEPIYAEIAARSSALFIHPTAPLCFDELALGYPAPLLEFMLDTTRSIADLVLSGVLTNHPGLTVIVPHAGAALPVLVNRLDLLAPVLVGGDERPVPSVRRAMRRLHFDLAGAPVEEQLQALLAVADPRHVHYGSDYPFTRASACGALATQLETTAVLTGPQRRQIFTDNALSLFPRLARTQS
ncbi:amidohydrolase family protein [Streptomyces sp. NPDC093544]|uniref:amidohydrolase family protein n=1 Tax=Streptomyces sp. NPDC093544 TaxID=3155200 RepID=UPI00344607C5